MKIETLPTDAFVVLFTGDREWTALDPVANVMGSLPPNTVVVHGWARGLDTVVDVVGHELGFRVVRCPSHWRHDEPKCVQVWGQCPDDCKEVVGRPAGVIRNRLMFDSYHPIKVIGFHDNIMESRGTKDMLKYAQRFQCENWLYTSDGIGIQSPLLTKMRTRKSIDVLSQFFRSDLG